MRMWIDSLGECDILRSNVVEYMVVNPSVVI